MKKTGFVLLLFILTVGLLLTACGVPGEEQPTPSPTVDNGGETPTVSGEKVLRFSMTGEPGSLDPHDGSTVITSYCRMPIYEGLTVWKHGEMQPGVAESWDISEDGLVYTFHLRDNATWWDGEPVTAQNFVDGFTRLIDPQGPNGGYAFYGYMLTNGEAFHRGECAREDVGIAALDTYTLEITLNEPVPYFLSLQAAGFFLPIRQDIADQHGVAYGTSASAVMGNGAYLLDSWAHESQLTYVKNPAYWDADSIKLDKVEIYIVGDENTALNMYETGELDYVYIPSDYVPRYAAEGTANYFENGVEWWMEFNMEAPGPAQPLLANANFRRAIGYALDRQAYVTAVWNNGSAPALRYTPDIMMLGNDLWGELYPMAWYEPTANLEKAEEYLALALEEVGMTREEIPAIGFLTDDTAARKTSAEAIQDMLKQNLGIDLEISLVQSKNRFEMMTNGNFDIVWAGYGPDYNDPNSWLERLQSTSGLNDTRWRDAEYDALIQAAAATMDQQTRGELLYQAEVIMQERGPLVPVYMASTAYLMRDHVHDVYFGVISDLEGNFIYADIVQ